MSRIKSNLPRVLGTVAAVTLSAMVGGQAWAQEIAIGAVVPSSGPFAEWGRSNTVTLKMLEQQTNDAGGINGAKLKITILDDAAKPAQAASSLRKLAGDEKVLAVAGPLTSSAAEVTFPVANEMKVVSTSQASSKPGVAKLNRPWAFRNTIDEGVLAKTTVPFYKKAFNIKTVAVIFDAKDATASTVGKVIMPAVLKANDIIVANENDLLSFNTGDLDVSAQVTKLKALNPDGVVVSADYSQAITVLREMKRQGLIKPVVGATQLISSAILKAAPEIPVIAPATFYATMTGPAPEKFTATLTPLLRKESGLPKDIEPSMYDANIYEIVSMYIDAIKKTGVTGKPADLEADRTKIRDHLAKLEGFAGLGGPIGFNDDGDAIKAFYVLQGQNGAWDTKVKGCSSAPGHPAC
ncbi:ABC transporter substrate-binding protein [Tardiphaga sp. 20_F10_N6_6]|jgi:branched-chain amino acid transport system substrate-binding protein|uniref:ABC transporter substrate-binding protein n=1 Tax=unclassified Tardiphaga TaxID=2631404 RepID=UPI0008A811C2|nr:MULTISPECIES: ABC transporter substrate-binding protein [unclassified Tardiphaga]WNV08735.1 ABC transporter substrate-binding protein [Tardiphaga sp. 709]SEI13001.1 amino acid/amide ABC transporter substrate-binding protein, HAAT family [Tardiphaga sp. OK245]